MNKRRWLSLVLAVAMLTSMFMGVTIVSAEPDTSLAQNEATEDSAAELATARTILVDVNGSGDFETITEALASITTNPASEADRVTIEVMPGTYREQIVIDKPYITLKRAAGQTGEVNITWYYASSYSYNNCGTDGEYDPNVDWSDPKTWKYDDNSEQLTVYNTGDIVSTISYYDKNGTLHKNETVKNGKLGDAANWGATIRVVSGGHHFVTEDIYYSNSFNLYVTQEELDAGVTPSSGNTNPVRKNLAVCTEDTSEKTASYSASKTGYTAEESAYLVRSKIFTERGAAFNCKSDNLTIKNCKIRSNQDTFYCGGTNVYVEGCDIYGGTDYIFGEANAVFNNCNLYFEGYSDITDGGVLTAASTDTKRDYGYLFMNCTILNARKNTDKGNLGRPWGGAGGPQVTFYNCTINNNNAGQLCVNGEAWGGMGCNKDEARFFEYGTKDQNGNPVDLSARVVNIVAPYGSVLDDFQILPYNPRNYLAGWDPMNFAAYLTEADAAIAATTVNVPENESTTVALPSAPDGITFKWISASTNAVVSESGTEITVIRPAAGEDSIESTVTLYALDNATGFGDMKEIPVIITPTTNTTDVFNIPVTVTESLALEEDAEYDITISKNGAVIKRQTVTVPAGQTSVSATIENIPASAEGIDYDIKIVSQSDELTITAPADGITTVTGIIGKDVPLNISAQKQVDWTVYLDASTTAASGNKTYDLIALAKAAGATDDIITSDVIEVQFDVNVNAALGSAAFIDISSGTPSSANGSTPQRFTMFKLNNSWTQIDTVDNSQGFSGSSNGDGQCLNVTGKFDYKTTHTLKAIIDYKAGTVSVDGSNSGSGKTATPYTFKGFPETAKGTVNMGVFVGSNNDFEISNITVTYKRVVKDGEDIATPTPMPTTTPKPTDDPGIAGYGTVSDNEDGSKTFYFGKSSITQSNSQAKIIGDTVNGVAILRPDYFYPGSNGYGELTLAEIDLNNSGYDKVEIVLANRDTSDIVIKVGGTEVASKTGVTTGGWSPYQTFDFDLTTTEASGNVTIEATVTSGSFCGNFAWLRFYSTKPTPATETPAPATETPAPATATPAPATATPAPATATPAPATATPAPATATPIIKAVNAYTENGNTVVELSGIENGVVIAAKYDGDAMTAMKYADVTGNNITLEGIEADKVFVWNSLEEMKPICEAVTVNKGAVIPTPPVTDEITVDFTALTEVPIYNEATGKGFVTKSSAIMPSGAEREVAPVSNITVSSDGAKVTESDGAYIYANNNSNDGDSYNYGGLIYRIDTGAAGAYHIEVEVTGSSADTQIAPTGMQASRLTSTSNWDNCGQVPRTVSAKWDGSTWSYDFATGEDFIEIEIEPKELATSASPKTVGVKKITVTPLANNAAGDKPTIHILGDSTQKAYSFNETISSWGQTIRNYFDSSKVDVVNYSMGGRAMKSNYNEGRFAELLVNGKEGDIVFIHSAHNDTTISKNRFSRGAGAETNNLTVNNEIYNKWLDMYVEAIKARGMTPVLVTSMPRVNSSTGKYSEDANNPNGFNPDAPANMRAKAASDSSVGLVELYDGAKAYINSLEGKEVGYIYNSVESGETPANNYANGGSGDGTHYRESMAKQWCRIMLQSICDQANASTDTYTDKDIMQELVSYMPESVQAAAKSGDWSAVYPEMASDVSAVGVVPGAVKQTESNFYYRTSIEKALQLGVLHKDNDNLFKPTQTITVGEYARGIEKAFGLEPNSLTNYNKTYAELQAEGKAAASALSEASAASDETAELADGEVTITVEQPDGGTVTVYNESAFHTSTADIPKGVTAGQVIADNEYLKLTAPAENIVAGTDKGGVFSDNADISTSYVEFRNTNPEKIAVYTAKATGKLVVYARARDDRTIELVNADDSKDAQVKYVNDIVGGTGTNIYGTAEFNVESGKTYNLYQRGTNGRLFGVKYESTDYPQSTETLTASTGDVVRVVATPAEFYINKSIVVNGEAVTSGKEYTFTATNNSTVTAEFTKEPALVEETIVASDAALTRQVMGAILYDAYQLADKTIMEKYMAQTGSVPSPGDPNYDPNLTYEGATYNPLVGWGALTDTGNVDDALFQKVKAAYNLGLIRSEKGIARGLIAGGDELEPTAEVTRAKAAKSLVFCYILTQPLSNESQLIPDNHNYAAELAAEIAAPNPEAPTVPVN